MKLGMNGKKREREGESEIEAPLVIASSSGHLGEKASLPLGHVVHLLVGQGKRLSPTPGSAKGPLAAQQQQQQLQQEQLQKERQEPQGRPPFMPTNCSECTKAIYISCELPNVKTEDIHVTFNERTRELTITAEARPEPLENGEVFRLRNRRYGRMSRIFVLPEYITSDGATVEFKADSVLRICFLKKKNEKRTLRITG